MVIMRIASPIPRGVHLSDTTRVGLYGLWEVPGVYEYGVGEENGSRCCKTCSYVGHNSTLSPSTENKMPMILMDTLLGPRNEASMV
jgi:hypothetical protein